eukprot:m.41954 g.41954  ORF g.41954 m.41954 type:complete len:235 (-) comp11506_c0_seq1:851-1555(-)
MVRCLASTIFRPRAAVTSVIDSLLFRTPNLNSEHWVKLLGPTTFRTEFLPLTKEDARVFEAAYHAEDKAALPAEAQAVVTRLAAAIDDVIETKFGGSPVFVKTSSRSAKDAAVAQRRLRTLYRQYIGESPDKSVNARIIALLKAGTEMLCVRRGVDAMEAFLHSERIMQDMKLALMQVGLKAGAETGQRSCKRVKRRRRKETMGRGERAADAMILPDAETRGSWRNTKLLSQVV